MRLGFCVAGLVVSRADASGFSSSTGDSNLKELGQCKILPILPLILQLGVNSLEVVLGLDDIGAG
jgi:hypothetical protein